MPADSATALEERAALWAVRVDAGTLSAAEEAELDAWTRDDPRHAGAFARAMAANAFFDRAAALRVADAPVDGGPAAVPLARRGISRRALVGGAAGAMAASMLGAIGLSLWTAGETIAAPLGSVRRASLRDGSAVTLNTSAKIRVALEPAIRRVELVAGEVNFDIAKDAARPFVVAVDQVSIRVVGTSFLVRRMDAGAVAVTVREGIVAVSRDGGAVARLTAGDRLVVHAARPPAIERLSMAEVDRLGLWQRGELDLTDMTLGDAAREFARYSDQRIVIADPAVARLKVAGIHSTSDPAGFARAAALAQGLRMSATPETITLSR